MSDFQLISFVLLWVVIIVEGVFILLLYRHVGFIYGRRLNGLPVSSKAPSFLSENVDRTIHSLEELLRAEVNILVFGSLDCFSCQNIVLDKSVHNFLLSNSITAYFIVRTGERDALVNHLIKDSPDFSVYFVDKKTFTTFLVTMTPFIYVLDKKGNILARAAVSSTQAFIDLCQEVVNSGKAEKMKKHIQQKLVKNPVR